MWSSNIPWLNTMLLLKEIAAAERARLPGLASLESLGMSQIRQKKTQTDNKHN